MAGQTGPPQSGPAKRNATAPATEVHVLPAKRAGHTYRENRVREIRTAIHESGHAVVASVLGLSVGKVTIDPEPGFSGSCVIRYFESDPESVRARLLCDLAGPFAEARFRGYHTAPEYEWEGFGDQENVDRHLGIYVRMTGRSAAIVRRHLVWETQSLVNDNWSRIEWLADHLMQFGTIAGYEIVRK